MTVPAVAADDPSDPPSDPSGDCVWLEPMQEPPYVVLRPECIDTPIGP